MPKTKRYHKQSKTTYFSSDEFNIVGRRDGTTIEERIVGLENLIGSSNGKSVLDFGCAEGLIALEFAKNGASTIDGFDVQDISIEKAKAIFRETKIKTKYKFKQADLDNPNRFS